MPAHTRERPSPKRARREKVCYNETSINNRKTKMRQHTKIALVGAKESGKTMLGQSTYLPCVNCSDAIVRHVIKTHNLSPSINWYLPEAKQRLVYPHITFRDLLIQCGASVSRVSRFHWIKEAISSTTSSGFMTGARYDFEVELLRQLGFVIIEVSRASKAYEGTDTETRISDNLIDYVFNVPEGKDVAVNTFHAFLYVNDLLKPLS